MKETLVSIIVRTLNEERYLQKLFAGIVTQKLAPNFKVQIVLVDSGSSDRTVEIAKNYGAKIEYITKQQFTFGRSLNIGCEAADGEYLVITSGHCIPVDENWISNLIRPLTENNAEYSYGKQIGGEMSRYSECQIFAKYFPDQDQCPQKGFFVNNANSAITKQAWNKYKFDEELTGLEDMELAKRLVRDGGRVAYVSTAAVFHLHHESWRQVRVRFEREAIALQKIMPEVQIHFADFLRYFISAVLFDFSHALRSKKFAQYCSEIINYRLMQYWGSYRGNKHTRKLSYQMKEQYFYPRV